MMMVGTKNGDVMKSNGNGVDVSQDERELWTDNVNITPDRMAKLIRHFYDMGYVRDNGSGMAVRYVDDSTGKWQILNSSNSLSKEQFHAHEHFIFTNDGSVIKRPSDPHRTPTAPFYLLRDCPELICIIHTHTKWGNLLTQLIKGDKFEMNNQEMIQGCENRRTKRRLDNIDTLVVPIIETELNEHLLCPKLLKALEKYPEASGILVRGHGFFIFGSNTWQRTKMMLECYEYLFEMACEMMRFSVQLVSEAPPNGSAEHDAKYLRTAMKGIGTDENALIEVLVTRSNTQLRQIKRAYRELYGRELAKDISSETSGTFKALLLDLMGADRDEGDRTDSVEARKTAEILYKAGEKRLGTDESKFINIFANQNLSQLRLVFDEYEKLTKHTMERAVKAEFSGDGKTGLLAICNFVRNGRIGHVVELLHKCIQKGEKDEMLSHLIAGHSELDMDDIAAEYQNRYKIPFDEALEKSGQSNALKRDLASIVKENK